MRRWRGLAAAAALAAAVVLTAGLAWFRNGNIGPVERGARLASAKGCLSCHGAGGHAADPDGTRGIGSVPSFGHEEVTEYARSRDEIREWILDGRPRRLRQEGDEPPSLLRMPAWRGQLSDGEVDALVAFVVAVSDFDPVPEPIREARNTIAGLGCFACHGPQGRGDTPNAGSLKGYIPSWSGADFPELVRDESELREWVRDGSPRRLRDNPAAAFFMRRQLTRMPAFGDRVSEAELQQIVAYVRWLRAEPPAR